MSQKIKILILALALLLFAAAPALAADPVPGSQAERVMAGGSQSAAMPEVSIPKSSTVELSSDYSAAIFSQLLGDAWSGLCGSNAVFGGIGEYSGLILVILQVFNTIGMAAAAMLVMYQWGIFAVNTAHEGKSIGGSQFNSLWVPVRSALGFSLVTPVYYGLSLLQVAVICSIGFGINTANLIYETATTYIVSSVEKGADGSTDVQSQIVDQEAIGSIQPLFNGVLLQEIIEKINYRDEPEVIYSKIKEYHDATPMGRYRMITVNGRYVIEHRPLEGQAIVWFRPAMKQDLGTFGGISIPAPTAIMRNGRMEMGQSANQEASYVAAFEITKLRVEKIIEMAEALRPWARWYIATDMEREAGTVQKPSGDGLAIAENYRKEVSAGAQKHIAAMLAKEHDLAAKLQRSLGVSAKGQTASGGWMGAGVLPTVLSLASAEADVVGYGGGVKPLVIDATSGTVSKDGGAWERFTGWWSNDLVIDDYHTRKLRNSPLFATQTLLGGRSWSGHDAEGDSAGYINQGLTYMFTDGNINNSGILNATIADFESKNPIVALMDFGTRCLKAGGIALVGSAMAGVASAIPGFAGAIAGMVNNPLFLALMGGLLLVGALCTFVAPLTPLLIWFRKLLGWFGSTLLALVGAPLMAISMILPEGAGFVGQNARKGVLQILEIALTPPVVTACLCIAYALLKVSVLVLGMLFNKFANAASGYMSLGIVWQLGMTIVFVSLVYSTLHVVFKRLVGSGAGEIMTWIGGYSSTLGSIENAQADKDTTVVGGVIGKGASGAAGVGAGAAGAMAGMRKKGGDGDGDKGGKGPKADGPANMAPKAE